ncbi:MAG: hypothetical protein WAM14_26605 [Candidatus Nitrosopolaris sp.]
MKYRSRSDIVGLLLDEADGEGVIRIFNVSYPDSRWFFRRAVYSIKWSRLDHIKTLINNVNSQGLAYFNSIPFIYS